MANFVGRSNFIGDEARESIYTAGGYKTDKNPDGKYVIEEMIFLGIGRKLFLIMMGKS